MSTHHRYEHAVLDVVMSIRGSLCGNGDPLSRDDLAQYVEWLTWRVSEGWEPSSAGWYHFDEAVRSLAQCAIGAGLAELAEPRE